MSIHPLLLSVGLPAASQAVQAVARQAEGIGAQFADFFTSQAAEGQATTAPADQSLPEQLSQWVDNLRTWLDENGIDSEQFDIQFRLAEDGTSSLEVSGRAAEAIERLLREFPDRLAELRKAAVDLQSQTSGTDGRIAPVSIAINQADWSITLAKAPVP